LSGPVKASDRQLDIFLPNEIIESLQTLGTLVRLVTRVSRNIEKGT
jgi:hypothetical protein